MSDRILQSDYMYWAKTRASVTWQLSSSEVPQFRLDRFPILVADLELDGASRYRYPPLRERIARKHDVPPEQVVMADGTSMANMLAMAALIGPGDDVVVEHPVYEPMASVARFLGASLRPFERRHPDFAIEPAAVAAAMTPRTRLILLTNLHNPTGNLADGSTLRAVGEIAADAGAHVLVDEVYLDAASPPHRSAVHLGPQFVTTSSLTKCYGLSGLRCGWILAAPELAERIWRLNELFGVAQVHAGERLSCLALDRLDEIAAGHGERLARNRALAFAFFDSRPELEASRMPHAITLFPKLLHGSPDRLDDLLRSQYDASIVPGRFFGLADHFRIGIGGPTEIIEGGLERIGAALDELR